MTIICNNYRRKNIYIYSFDKILKEKQQCSYFCTKYDFFMIHSWQQLLNPIILGGGGGGGA